MPQLTLKVGPTGPIVEVFVNISAPRVMALQKVSAPLPMAVRARLLVDTGASHTVIDPAILKPLGLAPSGAILAHTPSTSGTPAQMNQYDVSIIIPHAAGSKIFAAIPITEAHLQSQGIDGLLGRDLLASCLLIYSGTDSSFILTF